MDAVVSHRGSHDKAVEYVAKLEPGGYRECQRMPVFVLQAGIQQAPHAHHQGGDVVVCSRCNRCVNQLLAQCLGI